jgi:tripartite-type tricarboxylate transporter receptor subunit TctC
MSLMPVRLFLRCVASVLLLASTQAYASDPYPTTTIKLVLPLAPGGATDNLARVVGNVVSAALGQPIIIENRPGGAGSIASNLVAKANADGYTLLLANFATHAVAPTMFATLPYDPIGDFVPICLLASSPHILMVSNDLKVNSVAELIALAKARPGQLNYASSGIGSPLHLAGEYFNTKAGTTMVHVPYKSSPPALIDLMSGRVDVMFDNISTALPYVKSGKVRGLAVTSTERSPLAPDLPTVSESGLHGFETYGWWGVLAPARTPPEVAAKLAAAFMTAMQAPEVKSILIEQGFVPIGGSPAMFSTHIQSEIDKWRPIIKAANIAVAD